MNSKEIPVKSIIIMIMFGAALAVAQLAVPFASRGNGIELTVVHSGGQKSTFTIDVMKQPSWITFDKTQLSIENIEPGSSSMVLFRFSVDKSAPVDKNEVIQFSISGPSGEQWIKEIPIRISPPETFELFQNYPNPFNPKTTISYQVPILSDVSLNVYDILGKEVAILHRGMQSAGYHESLFNGLGFASGIYFYRLGVRVPNGNHRYFLRKMQLVK
jgi:hypothetical protein